MRRSTTVIGWLAQVFYHIFAELPGKPDKILRHLIETNFDQDPLLFNAWGASNGVDEERPSVRSTSASLSLLKVVIGVSEASA
jgi:hypothetical protein